MCQDGQKSGQLPGFCPLLKTKVATPFCLIPQAFSSKVANCPPFFLFIIEKILYIINRKLPGQMANSQILIFFTKFCLCFCTGFSVSTKTSQRAEKKNEIYKPYYEERVTHALSLLLVDF